MAAAALHPCVGHVYADAVAITAFDPRTAAERHLHMPLLTACGIDDPQVARLNLGRGDCPQVTGPPVGGCIARCKRQPLCPVAVLHKAGAVQIHPDVGIAGAAAQRRGLPVHKMTLAANGKGYDLPARSVGVNVQSGQQCLQLVSSQSGAYGTALDAVRNAVKRLPVHTIQQGRPFHIAISVHAILVPALEARRTGRQRYSFRKAGSDRIARIRIAVLVLLDDGTCQRAVVAAFGQCLQIARAAVRTIGGFGFRVSIAEFPIVKDTTPNITNSRLNNIP